MLDEGLQVGASVTLTRLMEMLGHLIAKRPPAETSTFAALHEQLKWVSVPLVGGRV